MDNNQYHTTFNTAMGWVGISGTARGLRKITLPCPSADAAGKQPGEKETALSSGHFQKITTRLTAYFGGQKVSFPERLDLSGATAFQKRVWAVTGTIPYGETRSYAWVAGQIGKPRAVRAVGQALRRNPLPIVIPCHRVLKSNGRLGGFRGGAAIKKRLIQMESANTG